MIARKDSSGFSEVRHASFLDPWADLPGRLSAARRQACRSAQSEAIDPALQDEYNAMRAKAPNTADGHWKVGVWCEQKGLKDLADMEFTIVCQLDPRREAAWKKLGYLKQNGKWTTTARIAAERAEAEAQRKADAHWRPLDPELEDRAGPQRQACRV